MKFRKSILIALFFGLLLVFVGCRAKNPSLPFQDKMVELSLEKNPPVVPECQLCEKEDERYYLMFDLNEDGVPEYFVENTAGAQGMSFALVDATGKSLTHKKIQGELGGDRLLILNSKHHGYFDILNSSCNARTMFASVLIFNGRQYIHSKSYEYGKEESAFIENKPGKVRACWYANVFARPSPPAGK